MPKLNSTGRAKEGGSRDLTRAISSSSLLRDRVPAPSGGRLKQDDDKTGSTPRKSRNAAGHAGKRSGLPRGESGGLGPHASVGYPRCRRANVSVRDGRIEREDDTVGLLHLDRPTPSIRRQTWHGRRTNLTPSPGLPGTMHNLLHFPLTFPSPLATKGEARGSSD
jgi:hypothetical protein